MEPSKRYQLNSDDGKKILIGLVVAVAGAIVTYAADTIPNVDFGVWTPVAVAGFSVLINVLRKWIAGNTV